MNNEIWLAEQIGTLFDIGAGKSVTPAARHGEGRHPFLRTSNIFWGRVDLSEVDTMHFSDDEITAKSLLKGDLLVCEGGDIGRTAVWNGELERCSFQNHLHRLRAKNDEVVPRFVMYYLQAGFTQLGIYEGAGNKTTIPNLSRSRLAALEVPKPPQPEQEKIAAVLWKLQKTVEIQDKLVRTTRELRAAVMRRLFTYGLRNESTKETEIGPLPESWDVDSLANRCHMPEYGYTASARAEQIGPQFLRITDITDKGVDWSAVPYCECPHEVYEAKRLEHDDIVFARIGATTGKSFIVKNPPRSVFASYLIRVRPKASLDADFLCYYFNTENYWQHINANKDSNMKGGVNAAVLSQLRIPLPEPEEQEGIAHILQALDRKIALHERKRAALQNLFQTLLHQLMTARIRVHDLDIDTSEVAV